MMNLDDFEGHTPAPWKGSKEQLSEYVPQPKALLCVFEGVELPVINMKSRYIGNDANKALIAAAPDLLAEVKRKTEQADALWDFIEQNAPHLLHDATTVWNTYEEWDDE